VALDDFLVPNTKIMVEKGTQIYIPIMGIHLDPAIYPNPMTYDPDRFAPEEVAKRHKLSFMPFGEGPRVRTSSKCFGSIFTRFLHRTALEIVS
jgi:cytochrome P450